MAIPGLDKAIGDAMKPMRSHLSREEQQLSAKVGGELTRALQSSEVVLLLSLLDPDGAERVIESAIAQLLASFRAGMAKAKASG